MNYKITVGVRFGGNAQPTCLEEEKRDPVKLAHDFARALGAYKAHRDL